MCRSARRGCRARRPASSRWPTARGGGARLLEEVLQRERVHDGAEHAHVVGAPAVHAALAELRAAEEVATADDDGDLDPVDGSGDLARDLADDIGVDAELPPPNASPDSFSRTRRRPVFSSITGFLSSCGRVSQRRAVRRRAWEGVRILRMRTPSRRYAPTLKRAKSVIVMPASPATFATDSLLSFA
jgi:hypothetical protein